MAVPSPAHKPRRKLRKNGNGTSPLSKDEALVPAPAFPLSAFLWPARGSISQWETLPLTLMVAGLFRWAAGLWGYSGGFCQWLFLLRLVMDKYATNIASFCSL